LSARPVRSSDPPGAQHRIHGQARSVERGILPVTLAKDKVIRADQAISGAMFEHRSCGTGTKGPRYGDWALIATADPREFLLIRRFPDRDKIRQL
jgi:hypothetical protein